MCMQFIKLKKAETLTYNFSFANNFTDINRLAQGYLVFNLQQFVQAETGCLKIAINNYIRCGILNTICQF